MNEEESAFFARNEDQSSNEEEDETHREMIGNEELSQIESRNHNFIEFQEPEDDYCG